MAHWYGTSTSMVPVAGGDVAIKQHRNRTRVLVIDDEQESPIMKAVSMSLDEEGWQTIPIVREVSCQRDDEPDKGVLNAIKQEKPNGVILIVRPGEGHEDQFKWLDVMQEIVEHYPKLPVLLFTQCCHGTGRDIAARGCLKWNAAVDFVDKLASPEEVVLRLRRLMGWPPQLISIGNDICLDVRARRVYVTAGGAPLPVTDIQGMRFEILRELATAWHRSPAELVPFSRLERYSEGGRARASLRVRIREIKPSLGNALGQPCGAADLIINVRDQGYRLVPPGRLSQASLPMG